MFAVKEAAMRLVSLTWTGEDYLHDNLANQGATDAHALHQKLS